MKKSRWSKEQKEYLKKNLGKQTFEEIAEAIDKSPIAVQLYVHRKQFAFRPSVKNNLVVELFRKKFSDPEFFQVTTKFIRAARMTTHRFWKLYRGEATPSDEELVNLSNALGLTLEETFKARQLKLFQNEGGKKRLQRSNRPTI